MAPTEFVLTVVLTFIASCVLIGAIVGTSQDNFANRALSCMANGNTIAQCQTVLGIKNNR